MKNYICKKHQAKFNVWRHKALSNLFVKKVETRVHVQVGQILFFGRETFADLTMEQKSYKLLRKQGSQGNKNTPGTLIQRPTDAAGLLNSFRSHCWPLKCQYRNNKTPIILVF